MNSPMTILGIAGSLRKASYNRATPRAAQKLVPDKDMLRGRVARIRERYGLEAGPIEYRPEL